MHAFLRTAHWLALTAGLAFMGERILSADVSSLVTSDVTILYSTYLGGSGSESGDAIAVDDQGYAYIAGSTNSPDLPGTPTAPNFPPYPPYRQSPIFYMGPMDAFVSRLDPSGQLVYSAYIGDDLYDRGYGVAASSSAVYVAGTSVDTEGSHAFVARLDHQNPYGTYMFHYMLGGGRRWPTGNDVAAGGQVTGRTFDRSYYDEMNPYRTAAFIGSYGFVELDGTGYDEGIAIDANETGTYAIGRTTSSDFPTVNAFQELYGGNMDAFVVKLGSYTTYLGGSGREDGTDIAVTPGGEVYVAGTTASADFPTTANALDASLDGPRDLFLAKFDPSGSLVYSTFLGGSGSESVAGLAVDAAEGVFLAGSGLSDDSPFLDPDRPTCRDNFVARLDLQTGTIRSICFPGAFLSGLDVDRHGDVYLTGSPASAAFPVVNAFQPAQRGSGDAFVAKLRFNRLPDCTAATAAPAMIWPPDGKLVPIAIHGVIDPDGDPLTLAVTGIRQDEPLTRAGVPDATGLGTPSAQVRADRMGKGDGRVYHIGFEARDDKGATCTGTVKVCMPHDQRPGAACGDGGALFDSTGS